MGIYCFTWPVLREALIEDEGDPESRNDFGGDVIPRLIAAGRRVFTHRFTDYWKDVGTVASLFESNMDLLAKPDAINLRDISWPIYSKNPQRQAVVRNIAVTDGAELLGEVYGSIVGYNVTVSRGAVVRDSLLMPGSFIGEGAILTRCIVGMNTIIEPGVRAEPEAGDGPGDFSSPLCQDGITVVAPGLIIRSGAVIAGNSMIGPAHIRSHPHLVAENPDHIGRGMEGC